MTDQTKPHRGTINNWWKWNLPEHLADKGLGYMIVGDRVDHPQFGGDVIRTSWVVKHEGSDVETRNSRYTLGEPLKVVGS